VLVGIGAASAEAPVSELMALAAEAAAADAGVPAILMAVDRIAVPQGSWNLIDPGRSVAARVGARSARTARYEIGVSQQELINDALDAVGGGDADVVLVVGAEARRFARGGGVEVDDVTVAPDMVSTRPPDFVAPVEVEAGIVWPVAQQYALIENALAAAEGLPPARQQDDIARLWARFNEVAQTNPAAAFPQPRTASDIATPGPKNRPMSFPYNVWHASQWTVDQAAALLFCSVSRARELGVPTDRFVFPHVAVHSSHAITLTARRHLHRWPAMGVLGRAAEAHLATPLRELALAEVYSCFPAAVRVQQRELGLDPEGTPTLTGGMAFAGGPFNSYVLQVMTELVPRLRAEPDQRGLITTVSGMLSKPGLAVWSSTPPDRALRADLGAEGTEATDRVPVATPDTSRGSGTVASATVTYGTDQPFEPVRTAAVVDLADGSRTAAACDDPAVARGAIAQSLIGVPVRVDGAAFTL
jgi:acetyl-CoA C-acetyltransferase